MKSNSVSQKKKPRMYDVGKVFCICLIVDAASIKHENWKTGYQL